MSISVDRFLASRDWGVYQDTETGHPSYVNRKTGELCDAVSIAVPPGSVILTPEEQERRHDYWLTQQDAAMRATQKQQASLRRKEGPKYFFVSCEESLWEYLEPATAARLIPAPGKTVGDTVDFGGLLGTAPVMPVNPCSPKDFIARGGRIPAPLHSLKN